MLTTSTSIIDAFDRLAACSDTEQTWSTSVSIAKSFGVHAINVGVFDRRSNTPLWARSSMEPEWLRVYETENYFAVDPLLALLDEPVNRKTIYCDQSSVEHGLDGGVPKLSRALNEAGYEVLHATKLSGHDDPIGKIITLCFTKMARDDFDANLSYWTMVASLLTSFPMAPKGKADQDVFLYGTPSLSKRETEVLQLLASGLQTARIAETLGLAEVTVSKHFRTSRKKLGALTREQALIKALRFGLIKA